MGGVDIIDLADKGNVRRPVARAGAQGGRDHSLQAGPKVLKTRGSGRHAQSFSPVPGPGV